jgi:hypothetical protein
MSIDWKRYDQPSADRPLIPRCGTQLIPVIEKQQRICTSAQPMLYGSVPSQFGQVTLGFSIEKSGANHIQIRIFTAIPRKRFFGYSTSRDICQIPGSPAHASTLG